MMTCSPRSVRHVRKCINFNVLALLSLVSVLAHPRIHIYSDHSPLCFTYFEWFPLSLSPLTCSMIPWVLPAEQYWAVLLRAVHQLCLSASVRWPTACAHTKNHMDAPRPVAMKRYSGRTGWMWMGWFGWGAYLGGPMRALEGCMSFSEPARDQLCSIQRHGMRGCLPARWGGQWLAGVWRA